MTALPPVRPPFKVSRWQILGRGLTNRCPNCGGRTLFQPGKLFDIAPQCPRCGLKIERDEGFFLGSMSLNYGFTIVVFLTPVLLLAYNGFIQPTPALIIAGIGAIVVPMLFYRSSRSWWLMNYYFVLPQHLPANQASRLEGDDPNL
jgi:DNA-directed RNA polymerase subunit RPC12/RpoP